MAGRLGSTLPPEGVTWHRVLSRVLDGRRRMGEVSASGVSWEEGLGKGRRPGVIRSSRARQLVPQRLPFGSMLLGPWCGTRSALLAACTPRAIFDDAPDVGAGPEPAGERCSAQGLWGSLGVLHRQRGLHRV